MSPVNPAPHLAHQGVEAPPVQNPSTLGLGLHVPVAAPLRLPGRLCPKVGRVRNTKPEAHGHHKVVIRQEVARI